MHDHRRNIEQVNRALPGRLRPGLGLGLLAVTALALGVLLPARARGDGAGTVARAAPGATVTPQEPDGKKIFETYCAACHQVTGEGTDMYPPLAGSEWVNGDEGRMLRILLAGLTGEVEVQGTVFNGLMPAWGPVLSDAEIAAVATYVRSSWGNKAWAVTPEMVARIRAATASRKTPWTAKELASISSSSK